jgi:Cu(I)/Ag(I) efflux system membrane fusion protein
MQVANEKLRLVPGQLGTLEIERGPRRVVTVPRDALVETGEETYVFVADVAGGEMRLHPRLVTVAHAAGEDVAIAHGVSAGERVVSGATFLVDSESRLRSALTKDLAKDAGP